MADDTQTKLDAVEDIADDIANTGQSVAMGGTQITAPSVRAVWEREDRLLERRNRQAGRKMVNCVNFAGLGYD